MQTERVSGRVSNFGLTWSMKQRPEGCASLVAEVVVADAGARTDLSTKVSWSAKMNRDSVGLSHIWQALRCGHVVVMPW